MGYYFPYLELAASLFILLLAFHIHLRHHENRASRFFVRFSLVTFFACILTYSFRIAFTLEIAQLINRFSASLFALGFSMYTHFALSFTHKDSFLYKKPWFYLFYTPAAIISALFLFTNLMYTRYEIVNYGIISKPAPLYILFTIQTAFFLGWGIFLFLNYARKAPQKTVKEQALVIGIGSLIPAIVGLTADMILPLALPLRPIIPTAVFGVAFMNFFLYLAMRKYSLFAISPCIAANAIINTMPDSMLVTDLEGRVLFLNEEAHKFFKVPVAEIIGKKIVSLFSEKEKYHKLYDEVVKHGKEIERFEVKLCDPLGECIPSLINANIFRDELGALLGIIFIVRDIRG